MSFYRPRNNRVFTGLCGGLGEYLNIDPTIIRLIVIILSLYNIMLSIFIYILLSALTPVGISKYDYEDDKNYHNKSNLSTGNLGKTIGILLVLVGIYCILMTIVPELYGLFFRLLNFWPLLLIGLGTYLIFNNKSR